MRKLQLFLTFIFACPGLCATPTHIELRGNDLPADQRGFMLPLQDATASGYLHEIIENGSEIEDGVTLPPLAQSTIERYAPCLTMIAQGLRQNQLPFIIQQQLRGYLRQQPDLYNAIIFADYLTIPLLLKAALAEAPGQITPDNVAQYEEQMRGNFYYHKLCQGYMQAHAQRFMAPHCSHTILHDDPIRMVHHVLFSPDGATIATGSDDVKLWNVHTGELRHTLPGTRHWKPVAFSPDSTIVATTSGDGIVKFWYTQTGLLRDTLKQRAGWINATVFHPDGTSTQTAPVYTTANPWDTYTGQLRLTIRGHVDAARSVVLSSDSPIIATAGDIDNGPLRLYIRGHVDAVHSVALSSDSTTIATGSSDNTTMLWDTHTGQLRSTLKGHEGSVESIAFSPDDTTIATASWDHTVKIWDTHTGQVRHTLRGHRNRVDSIAFSLDGTTIATASADGTAMVWDTLTGQRLHILRGHTHPVTSVTFSPDGMTLATASNDSTAKLWLLYPASSRGLALTSLVENATQPTLLEAITGFFARLLPSGENEIDGDDDA